jgi:hypothetical protein
MFLYGDLGSVNQKYILKIENIRLWCKHNDLFLRVQTISQHFDTLFIYTSVGNSSTISKTYKVLRRSKNLLFHQNVVGQKAIKSHDRADFDTL